MSKPSVKYADNVTTSPQAAPDTFSLQHSSSHHTADNDPENEGYHSHPAPPRSLSEQYHPRGRRTSAQSFRRRVTFGGWGAKAKRPTEPNEKNVSTTSLVQTVRTKVSSLFVPEHKVGKAPGIMRELRTIIFGSWFNVLLLAIPVSWALHFAKPQEYTLVFVFSFISIIPLAKLLAFATDELSIRVGETLAGLLNATLGNAVELIVAILALVKCELRVVQSSLVGSILSNILLVLGLCFFAGGTKFSEQGFILSTTQLNSSLLTLSVIGVLIPAAFDMVTGDNQISGFDTETEQRDILKLSHGTAIVLLFIYVSYLIFQLFSHKSLYDDKGGEKFQSVRYAPRTGPSTKEKAKKFFGIGIPLTPVKEIKEDGASEGPGDSSAHILRRQFDDDVQPAADVERPDATTTEDADEDEEIPELSLPVTIILLIFVTVLVAVTAEWLVDSIDGLASGGAISKEFIGLILLPIVGNAAEHATAVTVSVKDKLTLSLGVAVGSSIQIALFVIPFIVVLGWIIGRPITMLFDPFESIVLFLSVLTVNYVVQDGRSNWLEGMILICLYVIIALVFWFYPGTELDGLLTC